MRFRCQPKFQIPSRRATGLFPKLKSKASDSVLVCDAFG